MRLLFKRIYESELGMSYDEKGAVQASFAVCICSGEVGSCPLFLLLSTF
jgi:hypothetical protein